MLYKVFSCCYARSQCSTVGNSTHPTRSTEWWSCLNCCVAHCTQSKCLGKHVQTILWLLCSCKFPPPCMSTSLCSPDPASCIYWTLPPVYHPSFVKSSPVCSYGLSIDPFDSPISSPSFECGLTTKPCKWFTWKSLLRTAVQPCQLVWIDALWNHEPWAWPPW